MLVRHVSQNRSGSVWAPFCSRRSGPEELIEVGVAHGSLLDELSRDEPPDTSSIEADRVRAATARHRPAGSVTVNVEPLQVPRARPRCRRRGPCTMESTMVSPSPEPWMACSCAVEERKKRVNRSCCSSSGIPRPLSLTTSVARPPTRVRAQRTQPPSSVNFSALLIRFETRDCRFSTSPRTSSGASRHLEGDVELAGADGGLQRGAGGHDHLAEVHDRVLVAEGPRLQAREHEQVVGQRHQPVTVAARWPRRSVSAPRSGCPPHPPAAGPRSRRCSSSGHAARGSPWPRTRSWPAGPGR